MREVFFFPLFEKSGAKTFYCAHRIRDGREGVWVGRKAAAPVCALPRAGAAPTPAQRPSVIGRYCVESPSQALRASSPRGGAKFRPYFFRPPPVYI